MKFIIVAPGPYNKTTGGGRALHDLALQLRLRGHRVCELETTCQEPTASIPPDDGAIVILPEVFQLNPTRNRRVVRWILNLPTFFGGSAAGYGKDDLVFLWAEAYRYDAPQGIAGKLFYIDFRKHVFHDQGLQRQGNCHLIRKAYNRKSLDKHDPLSVSVDDYARHQYRGDGGDKYLSDAFNRRQRFISYDHATLIAVFAAMCGCETIVIPDGIRTVEEALADDPLRLSGIAWGFEDLPRAKQSHKELHSRITQVEKEAWDSIDRFVEICRQKWGC